MYYSFCLNDKRFLSGVSYEDFGKVPTWKNIDQAPPLDLLTAIKAAENVLPQYTDQIEEIEYTDIKLSRYRNGDWLYEITFEGPKKKLCPKNHIIFPILLSGKVVKPKPG